jgi:hypothetical protein
MFKRGSSNKLAHPFTFDRPALPNGPRVIPPSSGPRPLDLVATCTTQFGQRLRVPLMAVGRREPGKTKACALAMTSNTRLDLMTSRPSGRGNQRFADYTYPCYSNDKLIASMVVGWKRVSSSRAWWCM